MLGIIDFNPKAGTAEDRIHYVEKIREFMPGVEGIVFRDVRDLSRYGGLVLTGSALSAAAYQRMVRKGQIEGEDYQAVDAAARQLADYRGDVFGICFGSQLAAFVAGGEVGSLDTMEIGYLEHELTEDGREDAVFGHLPQRFFGAHMHSDFVSRLPEGGRVLATRNGMIYAYRMERPNGSVWYGCQPHPEMSTRENATFFAEHARREGLIGDDEFQAAIVMPRIADFELSGTLAKFAELVKAK